MRSDYKVYRYDRLDAPVVTAGSAAVLIGAQNGLFPDMGYAVPGEMGGLWAGEKKVCDGFFLAVDDVPLTQADACEIHPVVTAFHYRMQKERLHVVRRQFIPDGVSGCVIELTIENLKNAPRMAEVSFTVRTDILTAAAARGEDGAELGRDVGEYDEQEQAFFARDSRNPWHAVWGAQTGCRVLQADLPQSVYGFGNTQGKGVQRPPVLPPAPRRERAGDHAAVHRGRLSLPLQGRGGAGAPARAGRDDARRKACAH